MEAAAESLSSVLSTDNMDAVAALQARVALARALDEEGGSFAWPDLSTPCLESTVRSWLGPWCGGCTSARQINAQVDIAEALLSQLPSAEYRER